MNRYQTADPRAPRILLSQKATLITSDGNQTDVIVTDISVGGFRLKADETLYDGENIVTGEVVIVRVERREDLKAKIIWARGCEAGGVFVEPPNLP